MDLSVKSLPSLHGRIHEQMLGGLQANLMGGSTVAAATEEKAVADIS